MTYILRDLTNGGAFDGEKFETKEQAHLAIIRLLTQGGCGTEWEGKNTLDNYSIEALCKLSNTQIVHKNT